MLTGRIPSGDGGRDQALGGTLLQQPQQTNTTCVRARLLKGYLFRSFSLKPSECSIHSINYSFHTIPCKTNTVLWGLRGVVGRQPLEPMPYSSSRGGKGSVIPVLIPEEHPRSDGKGAAAHSRSQPGQHGGSGAERESVAGDRPEPPASCPPGHGSLRSGLASLGLKI